MKKKLALLCMAGVMVFSISACSDKKAANQTSESVETQTASGEEDTDNAQSTQTGEDGSESGQSSETEKVSDREDYVGIQDLDIEEYITLTDYKNMKVSAAKPAVDDETIESYINSKLLVGNIMDRAVEEGDVADIDYVGKKDEVAFQGGSAQGYKLTIGSGTFIPGFEEGLVGVMPGETVDLNLTFPENYGNADLAGQEVVFTVTVNSIVGSAEYATVTVKDMESIGLAYKTKEEIWEAGKKAVEENAAETFTANAKSLIVQKLVEESTASSIPDYLVEEEVQNYNIYMASLAQQMYGIDLETFVTGAYGITMEEYNTQLNEMCSDTVKQYLVLEAVAREEGIEITEDMIHEKAAEEAVEYGYASAEDLIDDVGYTTYRMYMVQDKVLERLMEIVTVEEEASEASAE